MGERIISNTEILAEIRAERVQLEKIKVDLEHPRREGSKCGAQTSAGTPCRRSPPQGGKRCVLHGGASPLARQEAERRLLLGVSLSLDRLLDALEEHDHPPCELCGCRPGRADPTVLRAAISVLDRSGFGPGLRLQHSNEEDEQGIREIQVRIVEPDPDRLLEYEASDREVAAARQAERQAFEPEPEPDRHSVSFDLGTDR